MDRIPGDYAEEDMTVVRDGELEEFRPQDENANLHTERGLSALEQSIQQDGWIGAVTVAADGESFDGSARLEKLAHVGLGAPIVVETDGTRPVVIKRTDIAHATDEEAVRLGIAANRVAELDLSWNKDVLQKITQEGAGIPASLFTKFELEDLFTVDEEAGGRPKPGGGGDEFDTTVEAGPTEVQRGDLWRIGPHLLLCGDATSHDDAMMLIKDMEQIPQTLLTDPPYNVGKDYGEGVNDNMTDEEYDAFVQAWFMQWLNFTERAIVTPGYDMLPRWLSLFEKPKHLAPWVELNSMTHGSITRFFCWEPILFYGEGYKRRRANNVFEYALSVQKTAEGESLSGLHPCPKPLALWIDLVENFTEEGDTLVDCFAGTGTTLIAAHRTGRRARLLELSPGYSDVIIRRARAEGIGPIERIYAQIGAPDGPEPLFPDTGHTVPDAPDNPASAEAPF